MEPFSKEADRGILLEDAACDAFAAQILLPAHLVDQHLDAKGPTASAITLLWETSNASRMAVCVRAAQHLPAPGHVLLLDPVGRLAFAASHGLPPLRRGSFQGDIPVIDRALVSGQAAYKDGPRSATATASSDANCTPIPPPWTATSSPSSSPTPPPGAPSPRPPPTPAPGRATTSARTATRTTAPSNPPARAAALLSAPTAAAAPARPVPQTAPAPAASSCTRPRCSPLAAAAASTAPDTPSAPSTTRVFLPASYVVRPR